MKNIIWLTGNSGAGKTTVAEEYMTFHPDCILLDGDEMRKSISLNAGFSQEDREEHNYRVARLARVLQVQGHRVIVSVIAPYNVTRYWMRQIFKGKVKYIYVKRDKSHDGEKNYPYQIPIEPDLTINNDELSIIQAGKFLGLYIKSLEESDE